MVLPSDIFIKRFVVEFYLKILSISFLIMNDFGLCKGIPSLFDSLKAHSCVWDNFWQLETLKNDENCFCFMLKVLFALRMFKGFCPDFLIKKLKSTSKFMMSQTGNQTITIHISSNASRSKGNRATKFGQLREYNVINIFLQNSCRESGRKTKSKPLFVF